MKVSICTDTGLLIHGGSDDSSDSSIDSTFLYEYWEDFDRDNTKYNKDNKGGNKRKTSSSKIDTGIFPFNWLLLLQ